MMALTNFILYFNYKYIINMYLFFNNINIFFNNNRWNKIDDEGAAKLGEALAKLTSLTNLNLNLL